MENVNFVVLGVLGKLFLIIHKDDRSKVLEAESGLLIKAFKLSLKEGHVYGPQTISEWMNQIPFEVVPDDENQELYYKLINNSVSDEVIVNLIEVIEQNKL